jgi:FkbM family methyltransferase
MNGLAVHSANGDLTASHGHRTVSGNRVVFDAGMNNGDDSAYYLSRGYTVVAIEANPLLVARARRRFEKEIAAGRMWIEPVGVGDQPGRVDFWINDERDVFSSFQHARAARNGMKCHAVEVECVTLDELLGKYGVPYYLKLDIEGNEASCLRSLESFPLPQYVSVEAEKLEFLQLLWQLGYREFAIVDQMRHNSNLPDFGNETILSRVAKHSCWYADRFKNRFTRVPFPRGSSGPVAEEARFKWGSFEEIGYNWLHLYFGHGKRGSLNPGSWYDFHARAPASHIDPCVLLGVSSPFARRDQTLQ